MFILSIVADKKVFKRKKSVLINQLGHLYPMLKRSVSLKLREMIKKLPILFEDQKIWMYLLISSLSRSGYKRQCGPCFLYLSFHAIHLGPTFESVSKIFTEKSAFNP